MGWHIKQLRCKTIILCLELSYILNCFIFRIILPSGLLSSELLLHIYTYFTFGIILFRIIFYLELLHVWNRFMSRMLLHGQGTLRAEVRRGETRKVVWGEVGKHRVGKVWTYSESYEDLMGEAMKMNSLAWQVKIASNQDQILGTLKRSVVARSWGSGWAGGAQRSLRSGKYSRGHHNGGYVSVSICPDPQKVRHQQWAVKWTTHFG